MPRDEATLNVEVFNGSGELRDRGFTLRTAPALIGCYDPAGDGADNDAFVLLAREEWQRGETNDPDLAVEMMLRLYMAKPLPNVGVTEKLAVLLNYVRVGSQRVNQGLAHQMVLGVETNGVGYAIADNLARKVRCPVIPYVTVGNTSNSPRASKKASMPRLAALDLMRAQLDLNRLKLVKGAPGSKMLIQELNAFVWKRPGRPEALEGAKDDMVMALCGAVWIAMRMLPPTVKQTFEPPKPRASNVGHIRIV